MPSRIIKESITTSETLALLSGNEERHFWRLIVQADDYGYLDARPEVLRAKGYAMMLDAISPKQSEAYTLALVKADLLHLFTADGKRYGHFPTWEKHQQVRAKRRKFPQVISCEINCQQMISVDSNSQQMITDVPVIRIHSESESLSESLSEKRESESIRDVASQTKTLPEQEEDQSLWPEWYSLLWGLPMMKATFAAASKWKEANGISDDLALAKTYALRDWWPRQPAARQRGDAYSTWQYWCREDKGKGAVNGKSAISGNKSGDVDRQEFARRYGHLAPTTEDET